MEEKEKITLLEKEKLPEVKTTVAVLEKEETGTETQTEVEEKTEKSKSEVNLQTLRAELAKQRESKKETLKKEKAIVSPNYDMIKEISPERRKKIYKVEKFETEDKPKPFTFNKKLKIILFSLIFFVAGAFCVSSGIQLIDASNRLAATEATYSTNLPRLIRKINGIDNSNTALELIDTYPEEIEEPSTFSKDTNWFDKICNFISGLFGG